MLREFSTDVIFHHIDARTNTMNSKSRRYTHTRSKQWIVLYSLNKAYHSEQNFIYYPLIKKTVMNQSIVHTQTPTYFLGRVYNTITAHIILVCSIQCLYCAVQ